MKRFYLIISLLPLISFCDVKVLESSTTLLGSMSFGSGTDRVLVETLHLKKGGSLSAKVTLKSYNKTYEGNYLESLAVHLSTLSSLYATEQDLNSLPIEGSHMQQNIMAGNPFNIYASCSVYPTQDYSCRVDYSITFTACPYSDYCSTFTCSVCNMEVCSIHDIHITASFMHGDTCHYHCTNSQSLADEWVAGCQGFCNECGKSFCKLCPHRCGEDVCPYLNGCNQVTCEKCHGVYCTKHNYHVCGNYTSMAENTGNDNISVQTTITGEAQVSVNITDNSQGTDLSTVESGLNQISANISNINNNINDMSANLISIDSSLTQINTFLPVQLGAMNNNIVDVKTAIDSSALKLNDIDNSLTSLNTGINSLNDSITDMNDNIAENINQTNTKLERIYDKLDNLDFEGDLNVDLGGLGGKIDATNTKLDSIINGNGVVNYGNAGEYDLNSNIGGEIEENGLTGNEIEEVERVQFISTLKNKLVPPSLTIQNYDFTYDFDIPTIFGEPLHLTLDFNNDKLRPVRVAVRAFSSLLISVFFVFGVIRMIREY